MNLSQYLADLQKEYQTGIAAEHAYRPALETLLESIEPGLNAVNDPKRTTGGAPDFIVLRGQVMIGFVEAKDLDVSLDRTERSDQMTRYLNAYNNLLLTDYLEFRWYVNGQHRWTVRIGSLRGKRVVPDSAQFAELERLLRQFAQTVTTTISSAGELAKRMANNAKIIRDLIIHDLNSDQPTAALVAQREAFGRTLLPDIDNAQFADMYAQTLAYGLFAARVNYQGAAGSFSRRGASEDIPPTNPFLRRLFASFGLDLGEQVTWQVDNLASLLAHTDTGEILKDFGKKTRQEDPVVHFYETFLREYDPALRDQRGVYYTPEPVVSYIVRSVDHILRTRFHRADGLADPNTLVLDPATGTGTFLYFVIQHIYETYFTGQRGAWDSYARDHLLRRIFGFELLMAPYAVAHMKLGLQLRDLGYNLASGQRLGVYLTNTLEEATKTSEAMFAQFISDEANEAAAIKRDMPIMVVLGNPPYSGHSANTGAWIRDLVRDYYTVDGKPLGERNPKWLQDDYVKFIRFGQWRIQQTGGGVLAFVTNHGYLDNPTFRGMRQQLMQTFTDIYVLDLHGNANKRETTPDGSPDQNVFDIRQGVSIGIFVKEPGKTTPATVHHADLWGRRHEKYRWLLDNELNETDWDTLSPSTPFYLFVPQDTSIKPEYEKSWSVTDIFQVNGWGIATRKDYLLVDFSRENITRKFEDIGKLSPDKAIQKYAIKKSAFWNITDIHHQISANVKDAVRPVLFRPFDKRFMYYEKFMIERGDHRYDLMSNMFSDNVALITIRRLETTNNIGHFFCTDQITVLHSVSSKEGNFVFPLYLYPEKREDELFAVDDGSPWPLSDQGRRPNLNPAFIKDMEARLGLTFIPDSISPSPAQSEGETFTPEDVFHYAYAVFHSPAYRQRYAEFLKIDFPRLPLTSDAALFRQLCALGARLVDAHLLRASLSLITTFPESGSGEVERGYPKYDAGRVYINKTQHFEGVPEDVWAFHVGGYQVLDKWLKDRRGRVLNYEDIQHYQRIVAALAETIRLMDEIDAAIPAWPLA